MTPKEKAFNLYFSFIRDIIADKEKAKKCAIKVCNEIINQYNFGKFDYKILDDAESEYWQKVKTEIERL